MEPDGLGAKISSRELNLSPDSHSITKGPECCLRISHKYGHFSPHPPPIQSKLPASPTETPDTTTYVLTPPILSAPWDQGSSFVSLPYLNPSMTPHAFRQTPVFSRHSRPPGFLPRHLSSTALSPAPPSAPQWGHMPLSQLLVPYFTLHVRHSPVIISS